MRTIANILQNMGYMSSGELAKLKEFFPEMKVVLLWSRQVRQMVSVKDADDIIASGEADGDYLRSVFIESNAFNNLLSVFGEPQI